MGQNETPGWTERYPELHSALLERPKPGTVDRIHGCWEAAAACFFKACS
ncbi:hypothetical protein HNR77_003654 [Paenibacillus sp. JGP012]|nr:hypothetical protein [Paenibacillus sp. JGP012]MBB6022555.1 hypothetical protein [Paenibacillus sp. JGP012]